MTSQLDLTRELIRAKEMFEQGSTLAAQNVLIETQEQQILANLKEQKDLEVAHRVVESEALAQKAYSQKVDNFKEKHASYFKELSSPSYTINTIQKLDQAEQVAEELIAIVNSAPTSTQTTPPTTPGLRAEVLLIGRKTEEGIKLMSGGDPNKRAQLECTHLSSGRCRKVFIEYRDKAKECGIKVEDLDTDKEIMDFAKKEGLQDVIQSIKDSSKATSVGQQQTRSTQQVAP